MPSRRPAISVVIPTRDRHAMLADAVASVLAQDFSDFELIVVDDGAGAADFLAGRFAATPAIRCADNARGGQVRARNLGVSLARGEIVAFLDDDDLWGSAGYLAAVRAAIDGENAAAIASGAIVVIDRRSARRRDPALRRRDRQREHPRRQQDPRLGLRLRPRAQRPPRPL